MLPLTRLTGCCVLLFIACLAATTTAATAGGGAAATTDAQQPRRLLATGGSSAAAATTGRQLQQLTLSYATPVAAGSTSLDVNGRAAVRPDGTVHGAVGGAVTSSNAIANPLLQWLTRGAYQNQPSAATTAYTQIPAALWSTIFPTLSYGLAEATGDLLSAANGAWANAEGSYNPISNNLGASVSAGTSNSANVGASDSPLSVGPTDRGVSGVEFAGDANDLTNVADSRASQMAQVTAYPNGAAAPINPATCTQAFLYGVALTGYDLGAPAAPLPREDGAAIIPYCLALFNWGVFDDFPAFVDEQQAAAAADGAGGGNGLDPPVQLPDGSIPPGTVGSDGASGAAIAAPPLVNETFSRAAAANAAGGGAQSIKPRASAADNAAAAAALGLDRAGSGEGAGRALQPKGGGGTRPGGAQDQLAARRQQAALSRAPASFADALRRAINSPGMPAVVRAFAATPDGQAALDKLSSSSLAKFYDGLAGIASNVSKKRAETLAAPLNDAARAASNLTGTLALNVSNALAKGAVAGLEATEPLFNATVRARNAWLPIANASRTAAETLAGLSRAQVADTAAKLLPADQAADIVKALDQQAAAAAAAASDLTDDSADPTNVSIDLTGGGGGGGGGLARRLLALLF